MLVLLLLTWLVIVQQHACATSCQHCSVLVYKGAAAALN
jgi:hypothetical protein